MICILKMRGPEIDGWIIATDVKDAFRRARGIGENSLAGQLNNIEHPKFGRTDLPGGYVMLVEP